MSRKNKKPITVITGCLGSGKTTLLQNILSEPELSENTGVIVNEFGKVGLDHHLLRKTDEKTILLSGGCICCNSREDLEQELKALLYMDEKEHNINRVIIETTGLADPAPILFTIATDPILQHHFYIDCVVATVDAENGRLQLKNNPELIKQVTVADKIALTKTDIANQKNINELKNRLREFNPSAELIEVIHGKTDPKIIEGNTSIDYLDHIKNVNKSVDPDGPTNSNIQSISFTFNKPLNWTAFGLWLSMLLHANGENVLRVKGLLDVGEEGPVVLNGVQHIIHPPDHLNQWPDEERLSHLIFILRSIEPNAISTSLKTFQSFLGTEVELLEVNSSL